MTDPHTGHRLLMIIVGALLVAVGLVLGRGVDALSGSGMPPPSAMFAALLTVGLYVVLFVVAAASALGGRSRLSGASGAALAGLSLGVVAGLSF